MDEPRDYEVPEPPPRRERVAPNYHKRKHTLRNLVIATVVLTLAGAGAYWFFFKDSKKTAPQANQPEQSSQTNSQAAAPTKHYSSANFALEFDHPVDWTVSDIAGSGRLTVRSPAMQLADKTGQKVDGQIVMTILNKQQPLPEFDKGNAVAAVDSEKIAYTKPSQGQRGSTYISFLSYANTTGKGIDGIYITGDKGYQKDQAIPKADFTPVDPVINVTFLKCNDSKCSGETTPLTISDTSWNDTNFSKPIKTMLQSLTIT